MNTISKKYSQRKTSSLQLIIKKNGAHTVIISEYPNMFHLIFFSDIIRRNDECYCKVLFQFRGQDNGRQCNSP